MKNYVIEIKDKLLNPILTDSIKAENADSAYEKFIHKMRAENKDIPFRNVYVKGEMLKQSRFEPPHYDGHKNPNSDGHKEKPSENRQLRSQEVSLTDQTQQEILSQLKQINWAIRIGFAFIAAVVAGIIKPGIFG